MTVGQVCVREQHLRHHLLRRYGPTRTRRSNVDAYAWSTANRVTEPERLPVFVFQVAGNVTVQQWTSREGFPAWS
jgi:hypothetical protein